MLPFMFDVPLLVLLLLALEFVEFMFVMFEFVDDEFMFVMFEFVDAAFIFDELMFDEFVLVEFMFVMFALLVLAFSAGEQAVQTPATVSKAKRANVLRIEFPPVPSVGSICWGTARS